MQSVSHMTIDKDPELHAFFQSLKEKDQKIPTPEFPEPAHPRSISWWIPLGMVASLALGVFFWFQTKKEAVPTIPVEVIVITLQEDEHHTQQLLIEEKTHLETWQSSTESLLEEF